jgi:hypothetical protein
MNPHIPNTLSHLVEFTPAETRIISLDAQLKPWKISIERLHKPSRIGGIFAGIVRTVDPAQRVVGIDINQKELAHLPLPYKHTRMPHIGERIIVQCKREAYHEKAPLMHLARIYRARYLEIRVLPHTWFLPEKYTPKNNLPTQNQEILNLLPDFHDQLSNHRLPLHTLEWQFTHLAQNLCNALKNKKQLILDSLLHDANLLISEALLTLELSNEKEKGLLSQPLSPLDNLIHHILPHDSLSAFGDLKKTQELSKKISSYPELASLSPSSDPSSSPNTSHIIEDVLAPSFPLSGNAQLHIEEISTLTAIDIDSGTHLASSLEKLNREAISLIPQLIFARNLSGLIVIDPLSSPQKKQIRTLVNQFRASMKPKHPLLTAPHADVLGATHGGLIEMTRQRLHPPLTHLILDHPLSPSKSFETQACDLIHSLSQQAQRNPQSMHLHQPLTLPHELLKILQSSLLNASNTLKKQWEGITLWHENPPS